MNLPHYLIIYIKNEHIFYLNSFCAFCNKPAMLNGLKVKKLHTKDGTWPTEKEKLHISLCAHPTLTQTSLQTPAVVITIIT